MAPNMSGKRQFSQTCHIILDKSPEITMHNHLNHVTVAGVHKFKMADWNSNMAAIFIQNGRHAQYQHLLRFFVKHKL